jgi:hypothetical protein
MQRGARVLGEVSNQGQNGVRDGRVIGWRPDILEGSSVRPLGDKDAGGLKANAARGDPEVPAESVEPPLLRAKELIPDPIGTRLSGENPDFLNGDRRLGLHAEAIQGFGDDLGGQACDRE